MHALRAVRYGPTRCPVRAFAALSGTGLRSAVGTGLGSACGAAYQRAPRCPVLTSRSVLPRYAYRPRPLLRRVRY
eukprot:2902176-Rhodomonas_salina.1